MRYRYTCPKGHECVDDLKWDFRCLTWYCAYCKDHYAPAGWKCEELAAPTATNPPPSPRNPMLVERETTHGDFNRTAQVAQDLKGVLSTSTHKIPYTQAEALDLICTKLARIVCGNPNEPDHWKDIAGYANLGEEACKNKD